MIIGKLGDYSIFSWKGAVNGGKVEVEDRSANSLNGSLYAWKRWRIEPSSLEFHVLTHNSVAHQARLDLESYQGTAISLTRENLGWIAKIISIEVGPALRSVTTVDNFDTVIHVKVIAELEEGAG